MAFNAAVLDLQAAASIVSVAQSKSKKFPLEGFISTGKNGHTGRERRHFAIFNHEVFNASLHTQRLALKA